MVGATIIKATIKAALGEAWVEDKFLQEDAVFLITTIIITSYQIIKDREISNIRIKSPNMFRISHGTTAYTRRIVKILLIMDNLPLKMMKLILISHRKLPLQIRQPKSNEVSHLKLKMRRLSLQRKRVSSILSKKCSNLLKRN